MDRTERLTMADAALQRAAALAREAERHAHSADYSHKTEPLATAGALWADVARAHAAIAGVIPAEAEHV